MWTGKKDITIEDEPEPKSSNIGGTTQHPEPILAINPEYVPLPSIEDDESVIELEGSDKSTPLYRLVGNRKRRRALLRAVMRYVRATLLLTKLRL